MAIEHDRISSLSISDSDLDFLADIRDKDISFEYNTDGTIKTITIQATKADGTSYTKTVSFTYDAQGNITDIDITIS